VKDGKEHNYQKSPAHFTHQGISPRQHYPVALRFTATS